MTHYFFFFINSVYGNAALDILLHFDILYLSVLYWTEDVRALTTRQKKETQQCKVSDSDGDYMLRPVCLVHAKYTYLHTYIHTLGA